MPQKYFMNEVNPLKEAPRCTYNIHISVIPDSGMRLHVTVRALNTTLDLVMPYYARKELLATSDCCDIIDEFFDCMNVRSVSEHIRK